MIISKTPLRVSFAGGGSDLPAFYRTFGGAVVSTSIDKYIYVVVNKKFDQGIRISYSKTQEVASLAEVEHTLVREALRHVGIHGGLEITSLADIPSCGTGLGSSSAFTVGLLHALYRYRRQSVSSASLGADSCLVEIDRAGECIGKQDQYASAFGGLNLIRFDRGDTVAVEPIACGPDVIAQFERSLLVFYTGQTRRAHTILTAQSEALADDPVKQGTMQRMVDLAYRMRDELLAGNLDAVGGILHENWILKRSINGDISNSNVDRWYDLARQAGAVGGKLLGAGAGGFLMFYAPPSRHQDITRALHDLRSFPVAFDPHGSRIILDHR